MVFDFRLNYNEFMKKLFLLLLLSLAFIGSANANSIQGAFGYKLGEMYKKEDTSFVPRNPLPYLDEYFVSRTPISKKIYKIAGRIIDDHIIDYCSNSDYNPYKKILRLPKSVVRVIVVIFGRISGFPLTSSRFDALTGRCIYNSTKMQKILAFKYSMTLEERFVLFAKKK